MELELNTAERDLLLKLLKEALADSHVEMRRTRNPQWQDMLSTEQNVMRTLIDRLQSVHSMR